MYTKCRWPEQLKCAEVVPVFKSGNKHLATNYRPISLIFNIAKIMEKLIQNRLIDFLNKNNVISDKQFGFMKNKGTKDALAFLTNYIYNNLNYDKHIITTFIDLAKAFDTVNHNILLNKLENYGIRGLPLKLMESYLNNRKQIKNHVSTCHSL